MTLIEKIRENLREEMDNRKLSMRALSIKAGLQEGAVKNIFNNVSISPGVDILYKLADALECSIDELCGRSESLMSGARFQELWIECIKRVDILIAKSKKEIDDNTRAMLYLAAYEYNAKGIEIKDAEQLGAILKYIKK